MSTVVAKNVQVGTSGTATDNFTIRQPATPDGTVRIANGNSGTTTDLVTVTSAGNVGVGTSSPGYKLEVKGSATDFVGIVSTNTNTAGVATSSALQLGITNSARTVFSGIKAVEAGVDDNATSLVFSTTTSAAILTDRMTLDSSGNLGLGVTPSAWGSIFRVIQGTGGGAVAFRTDASNVDMFSNAFFNGTSFIYQKTGYPALRYRMEDGGTYAWFNAPSGTAGNAISFTQAMTLDASGNLLVGTTSPGSGSSTGLTIASGRYIWNVGAYNFTTASGANLVVQSDGIFQRSSSAAKYKQDVRDLEAVNISNFRPVRYKSNCQGDDQTKEHFGIVADEVAQAGVEELVTRGSNGEVEGFQYDRFTVVLLKAIQEQQAIITALTDRITALESK